MTGQQAEVWRFAQQRLAAPSWLEEFASWFDRRVLGVGRVL